MSILNSVFEPEWRSFKVTLHIFMFNQIPFDTKDPQGLMRCSAQTKQTNKNAI